MSCAVTVACPEERWTIEVPRTELEELPSMDWLSMKITAVRDWEVDPMLGVVWWMDEMRDVLVISQRKERR